VNENARKNVDISLNMGNFICLNIHAAKYVTIK